MAETFAHPGFTRHQSRTGECGRYRQFTLSRSLLRRQSRLNDQDQPKAASNMKTVDKE
jgi:hypothetical protein